MTEVYTASEVETRDASGTVAEVSFPRRTITMIVMPYEQPTEVVHRGRIVEEVVSRGAFDGVERRTSTVRANREHNPEKTFGRAIALYPTREDGLVADVKVGRTVLGDEVLELASEGCLDASAGFALLRDRDDPSKVKPGAEVWETRSRRRLNHLWLDHIGLTPDPAYRGASVLAVRSGSGHPSVEAERAATPNLDVVRGWLLGDRYSQL